VDLQLNLDLSYAPLVCAKDDALMKEELTGTAIARLTLGTTVDSM
jgi:hypothetical protein